MTDDAELNGHGSRLPHKEEAAILALLAEPTVAKAAEAVGVSPETLWRWLRLPEFKARYHEARREALNVGLTRLQGAASQAVDVLVAVMADAEERASTRVSAAKTVLDLAVKIAELQELELRVAALESGQTARYEVTYVNDWRAEGQQ
jgi:hypothetical protein